jgi:hypothetical protein
LEDNAQADEGEEADEKSFWCLDDKVMWFSCSTTAFIGLYRGEIHFESVIGRSLNNGNNFMTGFLGNLVSDLLDFQR